MGAIPVPGAEAQAAWRSFRSRFVTDDGRVVDTGNGGISHSEGQGWGLLFAAAFNDAAVFERILTWTEAKLRRPHDRLHAWRYRPGTATPVDDTNNASDGDIFIAVALLRAASRWQLPRYASAAEAISRDILGQLVRRVGDRQILLPGAAGFQRKDGVVVNPSYYAFPFLAELEGVAPSPMWEQLRQDGVALITEARFGAWMLPPDWLRLNGGQKPLPAPDWPPRFSFDAVRIPLWLVWSGLMSTSLYESFHGFWTPGPDGTFPAWADLVTNQVSPYPAPPGIEAVRRLTEAAATRTTPALPPVEQAKTYYDAALLLLTHLALHERGG